MLTNHTAPRHYFQNLRIKKLYNITDTRVYADLEDVHFGYSIPQVRLIQQDNEIKELQDFQLRKKKLHGQIIILINKKSTTRTAFVFDASNYRSLQHLLGGGSACGKDSVIDIDKPKQKNNHHSNNIQTIPQNNGQNDKARAQDRTIQNNEHFQQTALATVPSTNHKNDSRQKPIIKIIVQELGSGNFGSVVEVLDLLNNITKAEKTLKFKKDYDDEKKIYENLQSAYSNEKQAVLRDLAILPDTYDDEHQTIHFVAGQTSLMNLKQSKDFKFTDQQIVHVFSRLLEFVLLLYEHEYCHSDLKPENVTFVPIEGNYFIVKVIDFGELTKNQLVPKGFTPNYFLNPMRDYSVDKTITFKNMEERLKNEFFTLMRTIQRILIEENNVAEDFVIDKEQIVIKKQQHLLKIQKFWLETSKNHSQCVELVTILKFIENKMLAGEAYQIQDLQQLLNQIKESPNYQIMYKNFEDSNKTISKIVKTKQQEASGKESAMSQLFGLQSFVYQRGSRKTDYSEDFDLLSEIKKLLRSNKNSNSKQQNIVLFGESGAGKSLFIIKLMQDLLQDTQFDDHLILFYKLRDLSGEGGSQDQLNRLLEQIQQQSLKHLQSDRSILLFLDGFDELNNKDIAISQFLKERYSDRVSILVTSRPRYALFSEFVKCFGEHEVINICPFNNEQRDLYINNSVSVFAKLKDKIKDFDTFDTAQEYIEVLEQQQSLKQLAQVPFTLSLILTILPKIKSEMQQSVQQVLKFQKFTKYKIYEIFEQQFTQREFKRILLIDEYKDKVYEHYEVANFLDIQDNIDVMQELKGDLKNFHQFCSWTMLVKQQLKLQQSDLRKLVAKINENYSKDFSDIAHILAKVAPVESSSQTEVAYIHKSVYEFFIAQSVIEDTLAAKSQAIDLATIKLDQGFLAFDLDILNTLGEHLSELKLTDQYLLYCETWYKSLLLTRKIKKDNIVDQDLILKLEKVGSNCINLLTALPWCDLRYRDFSGCAMPYAYLYRRDLTGSKKVVVVFRKKSFNMYICD